MVDTPRIIIRRDSKFVVERIDATTKVVARYKQGLPGASGGTTTTTINISEPSTMWNLAHYLGRYPSLTIVDSAGDVIDTIYRYEDSNVITVNFSVPTSGTAYLN